jgi:hypothetical protein
MARRTMPCEMSTSQPSLDNSSVLNIDSFISTLRTSDPNLSDVLQSHRRLLSFIFSTSLPFRAIDLASNTVRRRGTISCFQALLCTALVAETMRSLFSTVLVKGGEIPRPTETRGWIGRPSADIFHACSGVMPRHRVMQIISDWSSRVTETELQHFENIKQVADMIVESHGCTFRWRREDPLPNDVIGMTSLGTAILSQSAARISGQVVDECDPASHEEFLPINRALLDTYIRL